jgi:NAD(P)-dependent dehydrogenase (short-subunit alcohol dehydrogenase family)
MPLFKIDILINNAGINVTKKERVDVNRFNDEQWHKVISVNLTGTYYCSKPVIKQMIRQKSGKIINISSVVGITPLRKQCVYAASKSGVINLSKAWALELSDYGITVNAIAPGSILMDGTKEVIYENKELAESLLSHIPLKRPGEPSDIANAALFLASDAADYITGTVLTVDGGWTCGYSRDW